MVNMPGTTRLACRISPADEPIWRRVMPLSKEMRLLQNKWNSGQGWPKRLDAIEIDGIRGWTGQRIDFEFPIVAIVGENGAGKSTLLQAAASIY